MNLTSRISNWVMILGFVLIPLSAYPEVTLKSWATKWFIVYLISFASAVILLFNNKDIYWPRIGKSFAWPLLALAGSFFISIFKNWNAAYEIQILDWLCFGTLTLLAVQVKYEDIQKPLFIVNRYTTAVICILTIAEIILLKTPRYTSYYYFCREISQFPLLYFLSRYPQRDMPISLFGQQNMLSEYLSISLILQIYDIRHSTKCNKQILFKTILALISFSIIAFLQSRAALLSAACSIIYLLWPRIRGSKHFRKAIIVFAIITLAALSALSLKSLTKTHNNQLRLARWLNTVALIWANPLGIGPGQFEFGYLPYQKKMKFDFEVNDTLIIKSPHNGYLELAAEWGIGALVSLLVLLGILREKLLYRKNESIRLFAALFIFVLVDAFFAFPMENAFPFFICAFVVGLMVRSICAQETIKSQGLVKFTFVILVLVIGIYSSLRVAASLVENDVDQRPVAAEVICDLFPSYWQLCLELANRHLEDENFNEASRIANRMLLHRPENFAAIGILVKSFKAKGDYANYCLQLSRYQSLFINGTRYSKSFRSFCLPNYESPP